VGAEVAKVQARAYDEARMKKPFLFLLGLALWAGCAAAPKKDAAAEARKDAETAATLRRAFDAGRAVAPQDPAFVPQLEEASLAYLLLRSPNNYAGMRRLLDFRDRLPAHLLLGVYLPEADDKGHFFPGQDDEAFRTGSFFNSYDPALFSPFFRQTLLEYLSQAAWDDAGLLRLTKRLKLALRFTPRYAGVYPNQISPELRKAVEAYLLEEPLGPAADRLHMLLWWDERNAAWEGGRREADAKLQRLKDGTHDELLKLELQDALAAPIAKPERFFWMSFFVPGLGQVAQGDLQGGLLLGGLTVSAWVWMGTKLAAANDATDDAGRKVAYGDAAWAGSLALLGHGFTAANAAENARFMNIVVEWDLLSKPRLQ
jgi:hypothetical protein